MNSLWLNSVNNNKQFDILSKNIETDICIIGSGIFGITCAYYLSKLGYHVVVIEKEESIATKTTGFTTGKITSQHGLFYNYLISSYGKKFAKDYLESHEKAINNIKEIINLEKIKCDFEYKNNYVYTTNTSDLYSIKKEVDSVNSLGYNCEFVTKTGLPFEIKGAICFKNQAQFNPLKYIYGLSDSIISNNGKIYTKTTAIDIKKNIDNYLVYTNKNTIKSKYVIAASHYPFLKLPGLYFSKMYQSTSYVIAVDTKETLFNGMYINNSAPIFSFRTGKYKGKDLLIVAGSDHKTGKPSSYKDSYGLLENEVKKYYPNCEVLFRWNTEDCISLDKIPYIGSYSLLMPNVFVGSGFKKWGMTSSNVAANIIVDKICKKNNKYEYIYRSSRIKPLKNSDEFKNMLVQSTNSLLIDKYFRHSNMSFEKIAKDSGSIVEINNEKVGIYKDPSGNIYAVKPICTHLGCLLSWNDIDKTWDCPCHGSRFNYDGKNLYNPAFKNLKSYNLYDKY